MPDRYRNWFLALALIAVLASTAAFTTACGEKSAEKAVEKAIEEAAKEQGQNIDVDVDIDNGSGSVKVSGDEGDMQWQAGSDLELPEDFPTSLLPEDAKVITVHTSPTNESVVFQTSDEPKKVFDHCLEAITNLGYEVTNKLTAESGGTTSIAIMGEKGESQVMITGGETSGGGYTFSITLTQSQ